MAHAWVLFEKLIYKGLVKKNNRKIMPAICLLIAFKFFEAYGGFKKNEEKFQKFNKDLVKFIGYKPRRSLIYYELKVLTKLNFNVAVPLRFIRP